ncbi:MAG TPA: transglycosylase SLT domain-containing protein, partial [Mariprofundaceae bacterium]|nr:transglycosylase SLT domain-containing protein [Mariprofundaceae bacterium]
RAATEQVADAALWLTELPEPIRDEKTQAWVIRLHLVHRQWDKALESIHALPEDEQKSSRWSYWRARALAALDRPDEAQQLFEATAQGRGYYSFLSAERSGLPYRMGASDLDVDRSALTSIKGEKGIQRAHEWWLLGDAERASREWGNVLYGASPERWRAAAVLASQWQQHNHVIQAAYLAGEINALDQRFPTAFTDAVTEAATESGLSTSLIWSIIRQESAFNAYALSRTGAKGLMQLMPATASELANSTDLGDKTFNLFDPATNIRLGGLYLSQMVERFNHNRAIAAAAYNAGPRRVSEWLQQHPFNEPDIWIETIPYFETRRYVQQVMAFMVVYDWRQQRRPAGIISQLQNLDVALDGKGNREAL